MRRRSVVPFLALVLLGASAGCNRDDDPVVALPPPTPAIPADGASTTLPGQPPPADALNGFVPAPLQWDGCGGDFECATLAVPRDWNDPAGATIDLAVSRLPASGDEPLGALATNPGGPGSSGNGFIRGDVFDGSITERFDVLSWDPRGVGDSVPLGCEGDAVDDFLRLDSDPDDAAEQGALDAGAQAVGAECQTTAGDLLPFVGTASVARDLEAIRRAYGGPMAFYGFSYGTNIALHHLQLFPGVLTHVVLDGVVDPSASLTDLLRGQAAAFDRSLDTMFASCAGGDDCPDGGAAAAYDELAAALETDPLPVDDDELGPTDLPTAAILGAYDQSFWPVVFEGLRAAQDGDGAILLALADTYRGSGAYDLYQAVSCLDSANPVGGEAWSAFAAELETISPRFGATIANEMLPCAFWPVPSQPINGPIVAEGSGPVLVIGTTGDPATPLAQAEAVAATLADGHLLVHEGEGHTAYGSSDCVKDRVAEYLIDGALPGDGDAC